MPNISQTSVVDASPAAVWERITTFAGVNHELMPWMRMTPPRRHRHTTIDMVPTGVCLGRCTIWYLGFLPLDHDRMTMAEIVPGVSFHEVSTMATMRHWEHRRALDAVADGTRTRVTDAVQFTPRIPGPITGHIVRRLFAHRHRRLAAYFSNTS